MEPGAGRLRRPHNELRQYLCRVGARPRGSCGRGASPSGGRPPFAMRKIASTTAGSHHGSRGVLAGTASTALGWRRVKFRLAGLTFLRGREPFQRSHEGKEEARGDGSEGQAPPSTYKPEEANRLPPRPQVIMTRFACRDLAVRTVAEAPWGSGAAHVQSTATRRPRPQAVRARGASCLPLRLSAQPSPGAPWAPGLLSAFWERGSPDLPACGLRRGSRGGPAWPIFISTSSRPSRGAKPRGADDRRLPQARHRQDGSRGGGEIQAGYLARCP